jgi:hypothetical protein
MPANWSSFISNVESYIISQPPSPTELGKHIAKEYHTAIKQSQSMWGQTHVSGSNSGLLSTYGTQFERMKEEHEELQPTLWNKVDEDGNEIPFTGRTSDPNNPNPAQPDPEYADPDMEEVQPPPIDPEKMRDFLGEYSSEYDLHEYEFFEFVLVGGETKDEVSYIISNRILFTLMSESSGSKRKKIVEWVDSFGTWEEGGLTNSDAYAAFKSDVESAISDGGYSSSYIIDKVKSRTLDKLKSSYNETNLGELKTKAKNGKPSEMKYHENYNKDFLKTYAQLEFDEDNDDDDYKVSPILLKEFICYFSFTGRDKSSEWKDSQVESEYIDGEMGDWAEIVTPQTADDVVNNKNKAAPYMYTRQQTVDALDEADNSEVGEDPYEMLAEETIQYWKDTTTQPLKSTPPAPPCLSKNPLGGTYIGVYYGSKKKLAEGLRKALNAGKESDNIPEAANMVATALSVAYAKHLMELKFIYLGGIPVPLVPYVPMIGFVPNVF